MAGENDKDDDGALGPLEEDGTADVIRNIMDQMDDNEDDDGGFDQPMDEEEPREVVSSEKGRELIDDATVGKGKAKGKDEDAPKAKDDKSKAAKDDDEPGDKAKSDKSDKGDKAKDGEDDAKDGEKDGEKEADLSKAAISDLVKDIPEGTRQEVTRRLGEANQMNELFQSRRAEIGFQNIDTPKAALTTFMDINKFARENPSDYLAWVAKESAAENPHEIIGKAAERFGYKLVPAGQPDDDDPFADPDEAKAKPTQPAKPEPTEFAMDSPAMQSQRKAEQMIFDLRTEIDPVSGQLARPHFDHLQGPISALAHQHVQQNNGAMPSREDMSRFYDQAVADMTQRFGGGNPAAQDPAQVAERNQKQAAATEKARRASKQIDGTGQGASRHPALPENATTEQVVRHFLDQQE